MPDSAPKNEIQEDQHQERSGSNLERVLVVGSLGVVEKLLLVITGLMTLVAASFEVIDVFERGSVELADILLMFLYTEVIAMVGVFYTGKGSPFIYPIFIAITALSRLIVLQGKEMDPLNIVYEAAAIVLLAIAVAFIGRVPRP
jgi:protein PsiE